MYNNRQGYSRRKAKKRYCRLYNARHAICKAFITLAHGVLGDTMYLPCPIDAERGFSPQELAELIERQTQQMLRTIDGVAVNKDKLIRFTGCPGTDGLLQGGIPVGKMWTMGAFNSPASRVPDVPLKEGEWEANQRTLTKGSADIGKPASKE